VWLPVRRGDRLAAVGRPQRRHVLLLGCHSPPHGARGPAPPPGGRVMRPEDRQVRALLRTRVIRLNVAVPALSVGIVSGLLLGFATLLLVVRDGAGAGPHLTLLGQMLPGYRVTYFGALLGVGYGLVIGTLCGYCGARIYNLIASVNHRAGQRRSAA